MVRVGSAARLAGRTRQALACLVGALFLTAFAPTAARAVDVPAVPTAITIATATKSPVPYGGSVGLQASLAAADGTVLADRRDVSLWSRPTSASSWTRVGPLTYDPGSQLYRGTAIIRRSTVFQARFGGTAEWERSSSAAVTIRCSPPPWKARYRGRLVYRVRTKSKLVALTFDDGPNGRVPRLVKTLEVYGAKGTFFVSREGLVAYPKALRYLESRGMEIGNHTLTHAPLAWHPLAEDLSQIRRCDALIAKKGGPRPVWVRAMGGSIDKVGMKAVVQTNHLYANWDVDSYDSHQRYLPPDKVYRNVVDHVRPGSIVLLHMTHPESAAALPRICATLKARGYKMVTLSELAAAGRP